MSQVTIKERLAVIESQIHDLKIDIKDDLSFIKNNMTNKTTTSILKWMTGVIGTISISALITAFKLKG